MSEPGMKLTIHFGERDRIDGRFLADEILDVLARGRIASSLLLRGVEGFGIKHRLRTDRVLTLSEDLPLVAIAVDHAERIEAVAERIGPMLDAGLLAMERVRIAGGTPGAGDLAGFGSTAKLTLYIGRDLRVDGRPAHELAVAALRDCGVDGATVLMGVDGTVRAARHRARFFARNEQVPAMVISIGASKDLARAAKRLGDLPGEPLMTIERADVLKRDGGRLLVPDEADDPVPGWRRLTLFSSEQAHFSGRSVHVEAVRRLRREGAAGATALRGIWGYDGRHEPHGEDFWSVRRRVPTLTAVLDDAASSRRWLQVLDEITPEGGLITSERVPVFQAKGPGISEVSDGRGAAR